MIKRHEASGQRVLYAGGLRLYGQELRKKTRASAGLRSAAVICFFMLAS